MAGHEVLMVSATGERGYLVEQATYGAISPSTGRALPDRYIERPDRPAVED